MTDDLAALEAVWERTDTLFGLLDPADLGTRAIPLRHPFLFYLGHLPAFAWNHIGAGVLGRPPFHADLDTLFARGIDPDDEDAASARGKSAWPGVDEVVAYREGIRRAIREAVPQLESHPDPYAAMIVPLVLEHERMHHETLLYMIARVPPERLHAPAAWSAPRLSARVPPVSRIEVEAGEVVLGAERSSLRFGWDNEFPTEVVSVPAFELDDRPVTVGDWRRFVDAGGYRNPKLWSDNDWSWRRRQGIDHPDAWRRADGAWQVRSLFAWHDADAVAGWPVYVSLAEARAWCAWAGTRLPLEAELHRAAYTHAGTVDGAYDFRAHAPMPVDAFSANGRGFRDLVGNGWEWTGTPFLPRPSFEAHLRTYPGYSSDFFDGAHFVVFGASWATERCFLRPSFRNWYQHRYPYAWTTFRTAGPN
ncbi:MAG: ergothioneine biosynthesis protein EgtB [Myxococcota bacterium]|jgi:ergothioneine biosynthesis protein EgtB